MKGTFDKKCVYNCGDECTGECVGEEFLSELKLERLKHNVLKSRYETLNKKSIKEILSLFEDGEKMYHTDQIFRSTIDSIYFGNAPEKIIESLISIINEQQKTIKKLIS